MTFVPPSFSWKSVSQTICKYRGRRLRDPSLGGMVPQVPFFASTVSVARKASRAFSGHSKLVSVCIHMLLTVLLLASTPDFCIGHSRQRQQFLRTASADNSNVHGSGQGVLTPEFQRQPYLHCTSSSPNTPCNHKQEHEDSENEPLPKQSNSFAIVESVRSQYSARSDPYRNRKREQHT